MSFLGDLLEELMASVLPTVSYAEEEEEAVEEPEEAEETEEPEAEEEEDDEDDEDEDEEEEVDPYDALKAECAKTPSCIPKVHHYEECVERVTKEMEEEGYDEKEYKEDCVEEFFHLQHCLTECAAPRLFSKLK